MYSVYLWHEDDHLLWLTIHTSLGSAQACFADAKGDTSYPESLTLAGPWEDGDNILSECNNCDSVIDNFTPDYPST
jgi:hypothetical protein